jgi:hypothetical protein
MTGALGPQIVQEWTERRDDLLDHIRLEISQNTSGLETLRGPVRELYLDGKVELHVHWTGGVLGSYPITGYFCALFARCSDTSDRHSFDEQVVPTQTDTRVHGPSDRVEETVAVDSGKFIEQPQRMGSVLSSEQMRLQVLDQCLRGRVDSTDPSKYSVALGGVPADWELDALGLLVRYQAVTGDREVKGEMVETSSEVLQDVADDGRHVWRVRHPVVRDYRLPGVRITLPDEGLGVAFQPVGDLGVESARVFASPIELPLVAEHAGIMRHRSRS